MIHQDSATALLGAAAITAAQSLHIQPPRPVRSASAPTTAASVSAPTSAPAPMDSQSQSSTTRDGRIDSMFAVGPVSQSGSSETFVGIADGASQQPVPSANVTVRLAESNSQAAAPTSKSSFEALTQQLIEQRKQRKAAQAAAAAAAAATTGSSASTDSVSATDSSAAASSYSVAAAFELAAIPLATITEVPMELLEATAATTDSMAHGSAGLGSDAASSSESATTPAKRGRPSRQSKQLQSTLAAFGKPAGTSGAERAKRRRTGGDTSHMDTIIDISSSEEAGAAAALTESRVFQFKRAVPSVSAAEPMDFAASAVIGSSFAAPILVDNSGTVDLTSTLASTLSATSSSLSSYDATASSAPSTPSNRTMDVAATPPATALSPASSSQPSASSGKSSPPRAVGMTTRARNMASL
jgi:hypothetical protein